MRILMVRPGPAFSVMDVHRGWHKAFQELGCQVIDLNYDDRLEYHQRALTTASPIPNATGQEAAMLAAEGIRSALFDVWPDWLFIVSGFFIPPIVYQVARARGIKIAQLFTESPYEDAHQALRAPFIDIALLNDPTNLHLYAEHCSVEYMPHAYDPDVHKPGPADPDLASEFAFVGTGYPSRIQFLEHVDFGQLHVSLAGNWQGLAEDSPLHAYTMHNPGECIDNVDTVRVYQSTKVSANLYRIEAQRDDLSAGWAMGPREVELAATGTFYLRDSRPESDAVLSMLPTFSSAAEFGDLARWWATHDDERERVATQARAAIHDRTFVENARTFLRLAESI